MYVCTQVVCVLDVMGSEFKTHHRHWQMEIGHHVFF